MDSFKESKFNFQNKFSRLFNFGFRRKKIEYKISGDTFWAVNTSKSSFFTILFTLFGSAHLITGFIEYYNEEGKVQFDFYVAFGFLFIVGLICFRQFLWLVNGRQELLIQDNKLTLTKKGTFFTSPKMYDLDKISNIRQYIDEEQLSTFERTQMNISLTRKILFNHILGQILFDYLGKTIKVLNDLEESERKFIINEITKLKR
jgi:hypothetical protein